MSNTARLDRLLANMGYGSRNEIHELVRREMVVLDGAPLDDASARIKLEADLPARMTIGGEAPTDQPSLRLTPAQHGTDGFFVAVLERRS